MYFDLAISEESSVYAVTCEQIFSAALHVAFGLLVAAEVGFSQAPALQFCAALAEEYLVFHIEAEETVLSASVAEVGDSGFVEIVDFTVGIFGDAC